MCPCHSIKRSDPSFSGLWANLLLLIDLLLLLIVGVLHLHLPQVTMMEQRSTTSVFLFNIKVNWPSSLFETSLVKYGLVYVIVMYAFVPIVWLMAVWFVWCWGKWTWTIIVQLKWCVHISARVIYFFNPWLWYSWRPNSQEWVSWRQTVRCPDWGSLGSTDRNSRQ